METDATKFYAVLYERDLMGSTIINKKQIRVYNTIDLAVQSETILLSFKWQAKLLAQEVMKKDFTLVVTPRDLYFGNSVIEGARVTLSDLVIIEIMMKNGKTEFKTKEIIGINNIERKYNFSELSTNNIISFEYKESKIVEVNTIDIASIKSTTRLAESIFTLDEDINSIIDIYNKELDNEINNYLLNNI